MKWTKTQTKQMREFLQLADAMHCVPLDQWTSGSGMHTKPRALPPFVKRIERVAYKQCELPRRGTAERDAHEWLELHPRRKAVYVLDYEGFCRFAFEAMQGREI